MSDLKRTSGDPLTASTWNSLVDRLPRTESGLPASLGSINRSLVRVKNTTGSNRDLGELLHLSSYTGPAGHHDMRGNIAFDAAVIVWHTAIARAVVCAEPIPNGQTGWAVLSGVCIIKAPAAADEPFVMIDPATPTQCKTALSGMARCLGVAATNYVIANWGDAANLWRYELKEASNAPFATSAKLMRLDGTQFAPTISLLDPLSLMEDQLTADTGFCFHVGNNFYAIQAPC